jgi:hypothetical protein
MMVLASSIIFYSAVAGLSIMVGIALVKIGMDKKKIPPLQRRCGATKGSS